MSHAQEPEGTLPTALSGPILLDGRPTRAPAVVGLDDESTTVWLIDLGGEPCGAWVMPALDVTTARRALTIIDRRALIAVDPVETTESVRAFCASAMIDSLDESLTSRVCSIPELLEETRKFRVDIEDAVMQEAASGRKKLAPMQWDRPVPSEPTSDLDELLSQSGISIVRDRHGASPLNLARLARWAIGLWTDTERKRTMRPYLRDRFGSAQPLPTTWAKAVTGAYDAPFDL